MPAWNKFRFAQDRTRWPNITGYVPIPPQYRGTYYDSESMNLAYSTFQEATYTGVSGTQYAVQRMRWAGLNGLYFRDWRSQDNAAGSGTDAEAYLVTGYLTAQDSARNKFAPWLTVHCSREDLRSGDSGGGAGSGTVSESEMGVDGGFEYVMFLLGNDGEYTLDSDTVDINYPDASSFRPMRSQGTDALVWSNTSATSGNRGFPIMNSASSFLYYFGVAPKRNAQAEITRSRPSYTATYTLDSPAIHCFLPGDFTIEGWVLLRSSREGIGGNDHSGTAVILSCFVEDGRRGYDLRIGRSSATGGLSTSTIRFRYSTDGTNVSEILRTGSWWEEDTLQARYIALSRNGNTLRFWVDGTLNHSQTFSASIFYPPNTNLCFGGPASISWCATGIGYHATFDCQEFRITNVSRYKSQTIPGLNTVPFPRS